ncbi:MAG: HEAT repeat domain-containing protein [Thermodesulfobacteriota bacterium]
MLESSEIIRQLSSADPTEVREAAFAAAEGRVEEAVPALAALLKSSNLGVQEAVDMALRKIGGGRAVAAVIPLLRSDDAPVRNLSMDLLRALGSQDLPAVIKLLHDEDPDIRIFASDILGACDNPMAVSPLCEAMLKDPEVNVRYQAAVSLGDLGRPEAVRSLNQALSDEEWVQYSVIEALAKIRDDSSVGALVSAMHKSSDLVASMIAEALGEMGNVKAVPLLLRYMDKSSTALRNKIVKAVVQILGGRSLNLLSAAEREKFREYLLVALEDEEEDIQDAAIVGLGHVGEAKASAAVLALAAHMDPDHDTERLEPAIRSLATIGLTPALEEAVRSGSPESCRVAVEVLSRLRSPEAGRLLMEQFWSRERDVQRLIMLALKQYGGDGLREFLVQVLDRHKDGTVIKGALTVLGRLSPDPSVGERLCSFLAHPYDDVKEAALEACIAVGGPEMADRFRSLFSSEDPMQRLMAVYAMGKLGSEGFVDELNQALEDEVPDIRKVALEAFAGLCVVDLLSSLPHVVAKLSDENRDVRLTVVDIMGACTGSEVEPYLLQAMSDSDDWVRVRAVEALGQRRSRDAVPRLVELLVEPNKLLAIKAIEALGAIGGHAAFRSLLEVLNTDNADLHGPAEEALERIQQEGNEDEGEA